MGALTLLKNACFKELKLLINMGNQIFSLIDVKLMHE